MMASQQTRIVAAAAQVRMIFVSSWRTEASLAMWENVYGNSLPAFAFLQFQLF